MDLTYPIRLARAAGKRVWKSLSQPLTARNRENYGKLPDSGLAVGLELSRIATPE